MIQGSLQQQMTHNAQMTQAVYKTRGGGPSEVKLWKHRFGPYAVSQEGHKYQESKAKMVAFLKLNVGPKADEWTGWAQIQNGEIRHDDIKPNFGEASAKT